MKQRIVSILLLVTIILSNFCINVSASTSLSEDSAKEFLRFLSGSAFYTPKSDSLYYNLLIGNNNDPVVRDSFLYLVYKTVDENWYQRRLEALENSLEDYLKEELSLNAWELVLETTVDIAELPSVDYGDLKAVFECIAVLFDMRGSNKACYFNSILGLDPNDEYFDLLSTGIAKDVGISKSDKNLIDEWARYIRNLDNISSNITTDIQTQSPNTGGSDSSTSSYKITFDSNCSDVSDYTYTYYSDQGNWHVPTMTRDKYIFCGWYYDSACTQSATGTVILDSNKVFYAKWVKRYLTITLNSNCSSVENSIILDDLLDDENIIIPNMARDGHIFCGWYLDKKYKNEMPSTMKISADLTLYAKWACNFDFRESNGQIIIDGVSSYAVENGIFNGDVEIPRSIDNYRVDEIGEEAFRDCDGLISITIPDSVTSIGNKAFCSCDGLTSITIPDSVTSIGRSAFYYCKGLTSITIPDSVTSIGDSAFYDCDSLTSVTIGNSVTSIGDYAFSFCESLTSVTIGNSVTSIGDYAFYNCDSLTSITIPDSVTSIGDYAFYNCDSLTSITIPDSVTSIGDYAFYDCDSLTSIIIPDSVTSIGDYAFYDCDSLTSIIIPDSVTSIGDYLFKDCDSLTSVTIGNSVTSIGDSAFYNCDSLTSIIIPDSVTSIGDSAFYDCRRLASVTIGNSVTSIEDYAFYFCRSLTSVTIGNSVTKIGDSAFYYCNHLTSITIPDSVTSIGDSAFYNCVRLTSVTIGNSVTKIGDYAFDTCERLTSVTIGNSVTKIGDYAFDTCERLPSIIIPDSVTSIGDYAFRDCESLTSVTIPDSVTSIGNDAFSSCDGLTSITIPDSVTSIGRSAFYYCKGLTSVTIGNSVTNIGNNAFEDCDGLTSVTIGNSVTSIGNSAFSDCRGLTSIIIPDSVTNIGNNAFEYCRGLTSVTLGNSVTSIGEAAFYSCDALKNAFYTGTEEDWGKVTISANSGALNNAKIHYNCVYYTDDLRVTYDGKTTGVYLVPAEETIGETYLCSFYLNGVLSDVKPIVATQDMLEFTTDKAYDDVRVFVWDTETEVTPLTIPMLLEPSQWLSD